MSREDGEKRQNYEQSFAISIISLVSKWVYESRMVSYGNELMMSHKETAKQLAAVPNSGEQSSTETNSADRCPTVPNSVLSAQWDHLQV